MPGRARQRRGGQVQGQTHSPDGRLLPTAYTRPVHPSTLRPAHPLSRPPQRPSVPQFLARPTHSQVRRNANPFPGPPLGGTGAVPDQGPYPERSRTPLTGLRETAVVARHPPPPPCAGPTRASRGIQRVRPKLDCRVEPGKGEEERSRAKRTALTDDRSRRRTPGPTVPHFTSTTTRSPGRREAEPGPLRIKAHIRNGPGRPSRGLRETAEVATRLPPPPCAGPNRASSGNRRVRPKLDCRVEPGKGEEERSRTNAEPRRTSAPDGVHTTHPLPNLQPGPSTVPPAATPIRPSILSPTHPLPGALQRPHVPRFAVRRNRGRCGQKPISGTVPEAPCGVPGNGSGRETSSPSAVRGPDPSIQRQPRPECLPLTMTWDNLAKLPVIIATFLFRQPASRIVDTCLTGSGAT